jgi:hypothetical protein
MEEHLINVLWIDDEHEKLTGILGRARRNGIRLVPFKSLVGLEELEKSYAMYDGILLDAKFFKSEDDEAGTEDTSNVHRAKERILKLPKQFDIFILTGQAEAFNDATFNKVFDKVYKKGSDQEMDRLFSDLRESAQSQVDAQLRFEYKSVFDLCTPLYLGTHVGVEILALLKVTDTTNMPGHFNAMRKIVEDLFLAFNNHRLLPDEFVKPTVSLNPSQRFLAGLKQGEHTDARLSKYTHNQETQLPSTISSGLKNLLHVVQAGAHRSEVDEHVRKMNNLFLFKSMLFQLLDILVWFKMHIDSKPKVENWQIAENTLDQTSKNEVFISGTVIQRERNAFTGIAFFKPDNGGENAIIPNWIVDEFKLTDDDKVLAKIESYIYQKTGETRKRVTELKLIGA